MIALLETIKRGYRTKTTQGMSSLLFIAGVIVGVFLPLAMVGYLAVDVFMAYKVGKRERDNS